MTEAATITRELKLPKLYAKQKAAIFAAVRYAVIEASTKSGKTVGCMVWILGEAWTKGKDGRNWWWVAPTFAVAKIAYRRIRRMLNRADPSKAIWSCNDSELFITLVSGGCIWFKGADDPDSLYGEDVWGAVIDEASRVKEESWYAVRSTLTATRGHVRIIGNVKGRKNWAYNMARRAESGEQDMAYTKLTAYDAVEGGVLDAEEIADAKRTLPEQVFRELYLAEPSDDGGNPFGIKFIEACRCSEPSKAAPVACGVDLAKSVDFTWVFGIDAEGRQAMSERWQSSWEMTKTRILALVNGWPTLVDSTGVGDPVLEGLRKVRSNIEGFKFSQASKQQLMECLAVEIQSGNIKIADEMLINELMAFEYEYTRTGVRYTAPEGLHDDGVCALALAVYHWRMAVPLTWSVIDSGMAKNRDVDEISNNDRDFLNG